MTASPPPSGVVPSPQQRIWLLLFVAAPMLAMGWGTQWIAYRLGFDPHLGVPLVHVPGSATRVLRGATIALAFLALVVGLLGRGRRSWTVCAVALLVVRRRARDRVGAA